MNNLPHDDPRAQSLITAIQDGDIAILSELLEENPNLAKCRIVDPDQNAKRSLLHIATDWPGHFPSVATTIKLLVASGADVNAEMEGPHIETPLHWAVSSNDLAAVDALIGLGADLETPGSVLAGGPPLENAVGFQNWASAKKLVERGANTTLPAEAALGMNDRIKNRFMDEPPPDQGLIDLSFWNACVGGQLETAMFLFSQGADPNWVPDWCHDSPLDGAVNSQNESLVSWLKSIGASPNTNE